jgi:hypothetical protein
MTGREFEETAMSLGMSQIRAATFVGVDGRTTRRWIKNKSPVPTTVAVLLRVMQKYDLRPDNILSGED